MTFIFGDAAYRKVATPTAEELGLMSIRSGIWAKETFQHWAVTDVNEAIERAETPAMRATIQRMNERATKRPTLAKSLASDLAEGLEALAARKD